MTCGSQQIGLARARRPPSIVADHCTALRFAIEHNGNPERTMTPITTFPFLPPTISAKDFAALLSDAGLTEAGPDQWIAHCAGGDGAPVLLIVISETLSAADKLETAVRAAVSRGERVIGIWPQGHTSDALPQVLQDYGAGLVNWSPSALHAAICSLGDEWHDAGGGSRTQPPIDRNKNC